jgi:hypothetical protein
MFLARLPQHTHVPRQLTTVSSCSSPYYHSILVFLGSLPQHPRVPRQITTASSCSLPAYHSILMFLVSSPQHPHVSWQFATESVCSLAACHSILMFLGSLPQHPYVPRQLTTASSCSLPAYHNILMNDNQSYETVTLRESIFLNYSQSARVWKKRRYILEVEKFLEFLRVNTQLSIGSAATQRWILQWLHHKTVFA